MDDNPILNSIPAQEAALQPTPPRASIVKKIWYGPNGLRAGWRLLIFTAICCGVSALVGLIARLFGNQSQFSQAAQLTPLETFAFEGLFLFYVVVGSWVMAKIEGREFGQYGLPWNLALRKDFWVGLLWGFLATSGTMLAIFALGGVRVTGLAIHGTTIVKSAAAWGVGFLMVGLSEEFSFRGYPQFTLTTGMGFWPSAFVLSGLFGLVHATNPGESVQGELSVVVFGLLFCLFLRRTGNLWFAVGFHTAYDWGQTFFYGVPDSGLLPYHNLLITVFRGPSWLTGGSAGPEASVFSTIVLLIVGALFSLCYREAKYRPLQATASRLQPAP